MEDYLNSINLIPLIIFVWGYLITQWINYHPKYLYNHNLDLNQLGG